MNKEHEYDMSIHHNPDAAAWAKFFVETVIRLEDEAGIKMKHERISELMADKGVPHEAFELLADITASARCESKFKTMRHIETIRNYLNTVIKDLLTRQEKHDQSKLEKLEVDTFEKYTPTLRNLEYMSDEYKQCLEEMKPALDNHYKENFSHHPEGNPDGIKGMNLIDLVEMLCDWKASGLRHKTGDIMKSVELNQKRFGYGDELKQIFINTAEFLNNSETFHKAEES